MEREKRKIKLQQFKKGEKGLKKGSLRINSGSQELSTFVMSGFVRMILHHIFGTVD